MPSFSNVVMLQSKYQCTLHIDVHFNDDSDDFYDYDEDDGVYDDDDNDGNVEYEGEQRSVNVAKHA